MNRIHRLYHDLRQLQIALRKGAVGFRDGFRPEGRVEAILRYADGPKAGNVYRVMEGRNIVISTPLTGVAGSGGRDIMRRLIVKSTFSGSLATAVTPSVQVEKMILGTNTTAESSSDGVATMTQVSGSIVNVTAVSFDASNPYVTFTANWGQNEANAANIAEAGLLSGRTPADMYARKTFSPFTKTTDFTLQINWTLRF
jgi:hypothetical protein